MRFKLRIFLIVVFVHIVEFFVFWFLQTTNSVDESPISRFVRSDRDVNKTHGGRFSSIPCTINGEYNISCQKDSKDVYLPFTFIKKYFDVYGKLIEKNGIELFNWSHSYATVHIPRKKYDPRGMFTHFQSYKVEERDRVKCISATEGVPVSSQWDPTGYFYPTQIAQFGLSHYSKNLVEPEPAKYVLEDGKTNNAAWNVPQDASLTRVPDPDSNSVNTCFNAVNAPIELKINATLPILSFSLKPQSDTSRFVVKVRSTLDKNVYYVHFVCNKHHITVIGNDFRYGLSCGDYTRWFKLSRDVVIDVQKGIMMKTKSKLKFPRSSFRIESVQAYGQGCVRDLTLMTSDHMTQFQFAVDWFLRNQDKSTGGWASPVTRKITGSLILKPGWYSAMGQGHAISVLARAYYLEKDEKYLKAAILALNPFKISSREHGLRALFLDEVAWYEEYPTNPPLFVLNGFIYSLIGLYDLHKLAPSGDAEEAYELFAQGMSSLKKLLMAFDTGSGTTYDLRHITLGIAPKLARWDYHATHINQLYMLSTIDRDPMFATTAKRWLGYMSGKRAAHN